MAPRKNAKRVKRSAEVSPSPEERQPNEPDPISLTGYDDILSEVLLRLPLKRILLLELTCKKFLYGHFWSLASRLSLIELCQFAKRRHPEARRELDPCSGSESDSESEAEPGLDSDSDSFFSNSHSDADVDVDVDVPPGSYSFLQPLLDRMLNHCQAVRIFSFCAPEKGDLLQLCAPIEQKVAPQARSAIITAHPHTLHEKLAMLTLDLVEDLDIMYTNPKIPQARVDWSLAPFKHLKRLTLVLDPSLVVEVLDRVASDLHGLEHLDVNVPILSFGEDPDAALAALSSAAKANRATLKTLSFYYRDNGAFFFDIINKEKYQEGFRWSQLAEHVKSEFVVPLNKFRITESSLWSFYISNFPDIDISRTLPLFEMCYAGAPLRTVAAANDLYDAMDSIEYPLNVKHFESMLETMGSLLRPSWAWTRSGPDLDILQKILCLIDDLLDCIYQMQASSYPRAKTCVGNFSQTLQEIINYWPVEVPPLLQDLPSLLAILLELDPSWAKDFKPLFIKALSARSHCLFVREPCFEVMLAHFGDEACSLAPKLFEKLVRGFPYHPENNSLRLYLLQFRSQSQHLPKLLEHKASLQECFKNNERLSYLLAALVVDEEILATAMRIGRGRIGHTVKDYRAFVEEALSTDNIGTSEPLLSKDEKELVTFHFWKAQLEAMTSEKAISNLLHKLVQCFPVLPRRVRLWLDQANPSDEIKLNKKVDMDRTKKLIRQLWKPDPSPQEVRQSGCDRKRRPKK